MKKSYLITLNDYVQELIQLAAETDKNLQSEQALQQLIGVRQTLYSLGETDNTDPLDSILSDKGIKIDKLNSILGV